jgi:hypothetical protein
LSNITREKLKAAFTYQFDAMREHCEKLAIIAGYGKHLLELVDDTPVTPGETRNAYDGYEASKALVYHPCTSHESQLTQILALSKTARMPLQTGSLKTPPSPPSSLLAPVHSLNAAATKSATRVRVTTSRTRTSPSRTASLVSGSRPQSTKVMVMTMKRKM